MSDRRNFCAIDFETTGAVEGYPVEPWQVGLVVWEESSEFEVWESLLKVGPRPFHPRAPGRHEALREQLIQSPTLLECLPDLRSRLSGRVLVAHNVATEQGCLRSAVPMETFGPWIDTLKLSRAAWPDAASHELGALICELGLTEKMKQRLPGRDVHDALYDALGSALLLETLLQQPGWDDVSLEVLTHPDLTAYYRRRRS